MQTQIPSDELAYKPGPDSVLFHRSRAKNVIVIASIRSGKTYSLINDILDSAWNNPTDFGVLLCGPTFDQTAKTLAYPVANRAKALGMCDGRGLNKQTKTITLVNGKVIYYASAESPDTGIRGLNIHKAYMDEMPVCDEGAFDIVMGRLLLTNGQFRGVGTPKGTTNWVYSRFFGPDKMELADTEFMQFNIFNNPLITAEAVDRYRASLDPLMARQEIDGEWVNLTENAVYYAFDYERNVRTVRHDPNGQVFVGIDYNIDINAWVAGHYDRRNRIISIFAEGYGDKTTRDAGTRIKANYRAPFVIDDASGRNRQQGDAITQRQILQQTGLKVTDHGSNPQVSRRLSVVNAHLLNGIGDIHLFIDPSCKRLLHELQFLSYKPNGIDVDDQNNAAGHITDALGYLIYYLSDGMAAWSIKKAA